MESPPRIPQRILHICRAIAASGGRAVVVGGFVRDHLLGRPSKDFDIEVYGLTIKGLEQVLSRFGKVLKVGKAFGVLRIGGLEVDFSLPRRDNKTGRGHRGFVVELDPELSFAEAARRRDLTINSIALDPLSSELLDPHGGQDDLRARRLRATDAAHFSEDPLRGLRVAQFAARFEMQADEQLLALCRQLDLGELAGERIFEEFQKLLLKSRRPSLGFRLLEQTELLRFFPQIAALVGVPQDSLWHPEGDVWTHTLMVLDAAAAERTADTEEDLALMFAALCHDFGKALTTQKLDGRWVAHGHEEAGVEPTRAFLGQLRAPKRLVTRVCGLVECHLRPVQLVGQNASAAAYRRLARKLALSELSMALLLRLTRADQLGRGTEQAQEGQFPAGERFAEKAAALTLSQEALPDVVQGRHLIERGLTPGRRFKDILDRCRELQYESGCEDPETILDQVLGPGQGGG